MEGGLQAWIIFCCQLTLECLWFLVDRHDNDRYLKTCCDTSIYTLIHWYNLLYRFLSQYAELRSFSSWTNWLWQSYSPPFLFLFWNKSFPFHEVSSLHHVPKFRNHFTSILQVGYIHACIDKSQEVASATLSNDAPADWQLLQKVFEKDDELIQDLDDWKWYCLGLAADEWRWLKV